MPWVNGKREFFFFFLWSPHFLFSCLFFLKEKTRQPINLFKGPVGLHRMCSLRDFALAWFYFTHIHTVARKEGNNPGTKRPVWQIWENKSNLFFSIFFQFFFFFFSTFPSGQLSLYSHYITVGFLRIGYGVWFFFLLALIPLFFHSLYTNYSYLPCLRDVKAYWIGFYFSIFFYGWGLCAFFFYVFGFLFWILDLFRSLYFTLFTLGV